eukprot:TRINITY_DN30314_c0_g1_i1.p1 TRINITY_DN30314_c0_g1~~TRINITY_DN30314_c0_g1_i1.p1  ORF type:complete len:513 (-),score=92.31 TRINITY_DN30314_c0_g1_i1:67-1515(-)
MGFASASCAAAASLWRDELEVALPRYARASASSSSSSSASTSRGRRAGEGEVAHRTQLIACQVLQTSSTPELVGRNAGDLLNVDFESGIAVVEHDLLIGIRAAASKELITACEPTEKLLDAFRQVLTTGSGDTWAEIMHKRIGETWRTRNPLTVWLDDKVAQVERTAELCGEQLHLPIFAHALAGNADEERALCDAALRCRRQSEAIVVKPRHGANSRHISLWPQPADVPEEEILAGVRVALAGHDLSWEKECWQLSQVPKGALLQPLYEVAVPSREGPRSAAAPLELKVQVLFGEVVGGTLNTHPQVLWVTREGWIQLWELSDLQARGHVRCHTLDRRYGHSLPEGVLELLRSSLRSDWARIRAGSERLCRAAGLDELRVDWLLGDERWGSRIGELTYMGAGSRVTPPLSKRLARAFAAAHLHRLGLLELQFSFPDDGGSATSASLWPRPDQEALPPQTAVTARQPRRRGGRGRQKETTAT